ncbi:MAG: DUF5723 family protein [Bacteroidota bacterium]|nr:DUF5723 family protein [Bacteroidota bacterium]
MKLLNQHIQSFAVAFILCLSVFSVSAQQSNSLYYMTVIPQSNQLNPATQPRCTFYLGMPGFSSVEINAGNTSEAFDDILKYDAKLDSLVWFLHDQQMQDNFLSKLRKLNSAYAETRIDLISFGFRVKKTYLSFLIGDRAEARTSIPYDLARLAIRMNQNSIGTNATETFDLSGMGVKSTYYREFSVGASHQFSDKLTVGLRAKLLFGIANVNTNTSNVGFQNTGYQQWTLRSLTEINTSVPHLKTKLKPDGTIDSVKFESIENGHEARSILMSTQNKGLALDMGVIYKPMEKLSLSASVLDFGYIKWKNNTQNFTQDASYDFKGVNLNLSDTADVGNDLLDTLKSRFTFKKNTNSYTTSLSTKIYLGAEYDLVKWFGVGFLTRLQFIDKRVDPQYTLSLNMHPGNVFNFTLSYTVADKVYSNLGAGLSLKLGPLQWYLISDRIPLYYKPVANKGYAIPPYAKNVNIRTGMNLVFGYNHNSKKANKDKPLVEP